MHLYIYQPFNLQLQLYSNIYKFLYLQLPFNLQFYVLYTCNCRYIFFIIPHMNSPYKTSIDERLIFYNITHCHSDSEYCHLFAIAAGDIIKYQGGHLMRNADARTVRSSQETFNSNCGHDA